MRGRAQKDTDPHPRVRPGGPQRRSAAPETARTQSRRGPGPARQGANSRRQWRRSIRDRSVVPDTFTNTVATSPTSPRPRPVDCLISTYDARTSSTACLPEATCISEALASPDNGQGRTGAGGRPCRRELCFAPGGQAPFELHAAVPDAERVGWKLVARYLYKHVGALVRGALLRLPHGPGPGRDCRPGPPRARPGISMTGPRDWRRERAACMWGVGVLTDGLPGEGWAVATVAPSLCKGHAAACK